MYTQIFQTGKIGKLVIPNRIVMAPLEVRLSNINGEVTPELIEHYRQRAEGGIGLIIVNVCAVDRDLGGLYESLILDANKYIPGHKRLTEAIHQYGSRIAIQLVHPGRLNFPDNTFGKPPVAPSAIPVLFGGTTVSPIIPRALTIDEIHKIEEEFSDAALRAKLAGYDAVEIHAANGYLIQQFLSPRVNKRHDQYGGSLENRARFAMEIIRRTKEKVGRDFPVMIRLHVVETVPSEGYTLSEGKVYAKYMCEAGVDAIDVASGGHESSDGIDTFVCPTTYEQGWRLPFAAAIKKVVNVPVISVGPFREPEIAERALKQNIVDFISLGRQTFADPQWANKVRNNRAEEIRKCCSCGYCQHCFEMMGPIFCAINAGQARDKEFTEFTPAQQKKKVMIIGGGPAGMETARVAALRGHKVELFESESELGGQVLLAANVPGMEKFRWIRDYLAIQITKNHIRCHLNSTVRLSDIKDIKPEVVIFATGVKPSFPSFTGSKVALKSGIMQHAHYVLKGAIEISGKKVVVLGGGAVGCEVAVYLLAKKNEVTIISRSGFDALGQGIYGSNRAALLDKIKHNPHAHILTGRDIDKIQGNKLSIFDILWKEDKTALKVDFIVLARGNKPADDLVNKTRALDIPVFVIGDALAPRDFASAIYEGNVTARRI